MSKKTLHQLYAEHTGKVSDKWSLYLTEYDRLFNAYRDKPVRLLEIGVQNGGSLDIWSKYFHNAAALVGCDINPDCVNLSYDDPRISVIVGDANDPGVCDRILQRSPQFDIVIDDGSHFSSDIVKSFALYFPRIVEGGLFIAEDLHCSYWSHFEGGLFDPYSSLSFFKRLSDVINYEHWGIPKDRGDILRGIFEKYGCEIDVEALSQVHSVTFVNSVCIVRKAVAADNCLGDRIIVGSVESVLPILKDKQHEPDKTLDQSNNPWSIRAVPPDEEIQQAEIELANLKQTIAERDAQLANFDQMVAERDRQIAENIHRLNEASQAIADLEAVQQKIITSISWRITAPMRWTRRQLDYVRHLGPALLRKYRNYSLGLLLDGTHGNIEYAAAEQNVLTLSGWFFSTKDSPARLYATVNGQNESPLMYGYERLDVSKQFPEQQGALKCGFSGIVALENIVPGIVSLDIWAEFEDGSKRKCFSRRINLGLALLMKHYLNLGLALLSKCANYSGRFLEPTLPNGTHGNIEYAAAEQNVLKLSGWFFSTKDSPARLYATVNGQNESPLMYGYERSDVFKLFPEQVNSLKSGFSGIAALQSTSWGTVRLDIWAEFEDGSKHKCFSKRINLRLALLMRHYLNLGLALLSKCANYSGRFLEPALPNGMHGHLDAPQQNATVEQNVLNISGWMLATKSPITKLYATINGKSESPLVHGYDRPDVVKLFPDQQGALKSGFSGIAALQSHGSGITMLDIWVELEDGSKHKCFSRRITNNCASNYSLPPLKMLEFLRTVLKKAWYAYKQGRLPTSPAECWQAVRRSYIWAVSVDQRQLRSRTAYRVAAIQDPYQQWIETNRISPKLRKLMESDAQRLATSGGAKISVVVPVYNAPRAFLEEMIESVVGQIYPNWELCLADDASTKPYVREVLEAAAQADPRIRVKFRSVNGHICETTNDALSIATGDFIALLDHDDTLPPDALLHVAECIHQHPEVDWIYTDEDKIDAEGRRYDPQFKGAWSPEMAITHNYTHHLTVISKELMVKVGGTRKGFEGAQDLDLFLRVAENTTSDRIRHIPQICYHWRSHEESTASHGTQKNYIFDSAQRAIKQALERRKLDAEPVLPALAEKYGMCLYQLRWNNALGAGREVTIAIPTKDRADLLKQCVDSLRKTVDWRFVRLLIVDDRSSDPATLKYLRELENDQTLQCKVIHPEDRGDGFNYARLINQAARHVETPYFLQLNNDVEAMHPGWLEDMMGWMSVEGVGIVGARLIYPDHTLQHAGVIVGPHGGLADHQFHLLPDTTVGYLALPHAARNVSAVTGACLLTSMDLFREIGGFDEQNFAVEYNDVDFCLRVLAHGKRIVYSPQATLCHVTSASRGKTYNPKEHLNFVTKYRGFKDPFFNRSMMPDEMWMTVNGGYVVNAERMQKLNVLFVVHALTLTGAPIVTYELARYLSEITGFNVSVVSMADGPVRERFEDSGMPVRVLADFPNMWRMNAADAQAALKAIGEEIDIAAYDLVVSNTLVCFWGVLAADMFKVPSMWNIHESVGAASYCSMFSDISMGEFVASAFTKAGRTVFQAEATRRMYDDFDAYGRFRTIPGGMSLARIAEYRAAHDKDALRQQYGIDLNKRVVTLIGTTCERKGQAVFLDSINLLETKFADGMPDDLEFLLVGAIEGLYLDMLKKTIARNGWKNVHLIGETKEIYDYYALSDIFVCASFEESFPMVILLAMAFELPIVSTNVFGIPEILSDGHDAALMQPGNPALMADALYRCLTDRKNAEAMADRAYAKLHRLFDNSQLHARYARLAQEVAMEDVYEAPVDEALVD